MCCFSILSCLQKFCHCYRSAKPCGKQCKCVDCANKKGDSVDYENNFSDKSGGSKHGLSSKPAVEPEPLKFRKKNILRNIVHGIAFDMLPISKTAQASTSNKAQKSPTSWKGTEGKEATSINGSMQFLVKRTFDEMKGILTTETTYEVHPRPRKGRLRADTFAREIMTNVRAQLGHMLRTADEAEAKVRSTAKAEQQQQHQRKIVQRTQTARQQSSNEPDYGKIIPVRTTFTKNFDVLGEFEGVVVSVPHSSNPYYQVEYEDGGSEALLHPALVALLRTSRVKRTAAPAPTVWRNTGSVATPSIQSPLSSKKIMVLVREAREKALSRACEEMLARRK
jgi:hypothetical protein